MEDGKRKTVAGAPAFAHVTEVGVDYPGLTKREWFAGMALLGCAAADSANDWSTAQQAKFAQSMADNLIRELNKEDDR